MGDLRRWRHYGWKRSRLRDGKAAAVYRLVCAQSGWMTFGCQGRNTIVKTTTLEIQNDGRLPTSHITSHVIFSIDLLSLTAISALALLFLAGGSSRVSARDATVNCLEITLATPLTAVMSVHGIESGSAKPTPVHIFFLRAAWGNKPLPKERRLPPANNSSGSPDRNANSMMMMVRPPSYHLTLILSFFHPSLPASSSFPVVLNVTSQLCDRFLPRGLPADDDVW